MPVPMLCAFKDGNKRVRRSLVGADVADLSSEPATKTLKRIGV